MARRIIEISGFDAHLSVRLGQVRVGRGEEIAGQFPASEVGLLISDTRQSTFSNSSMVEIIENKGLIVLCGNDHLPAALVVPVTGNDLMRQRLTEQLAMSAPTRKRLWQEIVMSKIANQAAACDCSETTKKLLSLRGRIKSGDTSNMEGTAARFYWKAYLPNSNFRRDPNGDSPNPLLNYGYMVMRASIARALYAAGLNPIFGLQHSNRNNAFCLVDDLVEPFRPWVDITVKKLYLEGVRELNPRAKAIILQIFFEQCAVENFRVTVQAAMDRLCRGYLNRVLGKDDPLPVPRLIAVGEDLPEFSPTNEDTEETFRV